MDRKESRRHKQEDKHMDRHTGESRHYPIRLLKESKPRKQRRKEKSERQKTETESATDKRQREASIYSRRKRRNQGDRKQYKEKYTGDKPRTNFQDGVKM